MKRSLLVLSCLFIAATLFAQVDSVKHPYQKFPTYPPVRLLQTDSVSFYTKEDLPKKKPVMLVLFNPQCQHCQHEAEELTKNIDQFKDVQIVMATTMLFDSMMTFREKYKLADHPNIVVAQDTHFFLPSFFMIHNLPFHAFYNKKKELISVFEGSMTIEKMVKELENK